MLVSFVDRACLTICDISITVRFSRIVFENFQKILISCLTAESRDV